MAITATKQKTLVHVYSLSTGTSRHIVEYGESIISELSSDGFHLVEGIVISLSVNSIELPCEGLDSYTVVYANKVGVLNFNLRLLVNQTKPLGK